MTRTDVGHGREMNLHLIARESVFSTSDAAGIGLDKNALKRLVRDGRCIRLTPGWYAVIDGEAPRGEALHRLTASALGRQFRARAAVSHYSRLLLATLPTYAAALDTVHLTSVTAGGAASRRPSSVTVSRRCVTIHRPVRGLDSPQSDGHPAHLPRTVPVAHAIVQAGLLAGPEAFLVPADAALRRELVTLERLERAAAAFAHHTGIGPVRCALPLADGRRESPGESRTAFLLSALGFQLEPQFEVVCERRLFRADFRVRGTRVLVEFDGAVKYAGGDGRTLFEEKRREDALRRDGWVVVRLVWSDLRDPERVRRLMLEALRDAG